MKNSNLIKMFLVMVVSLCLILVATYTFADDEGTTPIDLTNSIVDTSNNTTTDTENSTDTNSASNTNTDNFVSLDDNVSNTNTNSNTNSTYNSLVTTNNTNSSSYSTNNTNLPSTGLEGSGLTVALIVILAISGVYAFKKIRDYKNI